jgi:hypothetical protein
MLRLFRSIRMSLIKENRTAKYLKYAVGEILLIVIGILVAVQIGSWSEQRKLNQKRLELIENLKSDFQINLTRLEEVVAIGQSIDEGLLAFMKIAAGDNSHLTVNEIKVMAASAMVGLVFQPALGSYHAALSTGSMALIDDDSLTELFIDFEDEIRRFINLEDVARQDHFLGAMSSVRQKLGGLEPLFLHPESTTLLLGDLPDAYTLSDEEFRDMIAQKEVYAAMSSKWELKKRLLGRLESLKETTEQILAALEAL